jgi:hypothetical protein
MFEKDPNINTREDYIRALRRLYAPLRGIGLMAVLMGALCMIYAPNLGIGWAKYVGAGLSIFGWVIIVYVVVQRTRWAKINRIEG